MTVQENYLSPEKLARGLQGKAVYLDKNAVDTIIIHWTGPYPKQNPATVRNWFENGVDGKGVQASVHFIIKNDEVVQTLPLNEVGWHSGDKRNYSSIGIEVIAQDESGVFSASLIASLKEVIALIRTTYPDTNVVRHFDGVQKKDCPRYYTPLGAGGEEAWETLKILIGA